MAAAASSQQSATTTDFRSKLDSWIAICSQEDDKNGLPISNPEEIREGVQNCFQELGGGKQDDALAQLIQKLSGAFGGDNLSYCYRALLAVVGGILGCTSSSSDNNNVTIGRLGHKTIQLLGTFFLEHCKPIDDHEYMEDYDTLIRDVTMQGLSALVESYPSLDDEDYAPSVLSLIHI